MTFDERVQTLTPLGLTDRQTRFLVTVALHGGYCVRRQYATFAGVRYGKNVRDFLDQLVELRIAARFSCRTDRGHVYHVNARPVYRAIGHEDNRNRRHVSQALIARKLMLLDFVLELPGASWFATEGDKVSLFLEQFNVPESSLPRRVYEGERIDEAPTSRFFVHKLPIYLAAENAVPHFVYLATELGTHAFEQFLRDHLSLFHALPEWIRTVRHICRLQEPNRDALTQYARFIGDTPDYVLNQLIDTTLAKDREFVTWRADPQNAEAVAAARPRNGSGRGRAEHTV